MKANALRKARLPALLYANGAGDHFLTLPAARAVARLFPKRLALICENLGRLIFLPNIRFRSSCELTKTRGSRVLLPARLFDADRAAVAIEPCDLLISLNPWHSESVDRLLERLAPHSSVGFFQEFCHHVKLDYSKHSSELAFDIPRALDPSLNFDDFSKPPNFSLQFVKQASRVRNVFPKGFRVLAVHADTGAPKMWPRQRFAQFLDLFLQQRPDFLALIVGWTDMHLETGRHRNRVIPAYRLPLPTSALLVGWSDLFVGIDSCMLHVADLFRVPGVGIFGPTNPAEFGFKFAPHRHVCAQGPLSTLRETEVFEALMHLLAETESCCRQYK